MTYLELCEHRKVKSPLDKVNNVEHSTSSPWRRTRSEDLGPRPQSVYIWGVSSLARSAI